MDNKDTFHSSFPMPQPVSIYIHQSMSFPRKVRIEFNLCLDRANKMNNSNPTPDIIDITGSSRLNVSG